MWSSTSAPTTEHWVETIYSFYTFMRIRATLLGCGALSAMLCFVMFAGGVALAQSAAEGQLPSHPEPQASPQSPSSPQVPRTAPSTAPSSTPVKEPTAAGAQAAIVIPAAAERHYHAGRAAEKDKDTETAIAEYRAAIKGYADYVDARYRLAHLLMDQDRKSTRLNSSHLGLSY